MTCIVVVCMHADNSDAEVMHFKLTLAKLTDFIASYYCYKVCYKKAIAIAIKSVSFASVLNRAKTSILNFRPT